MDLDQLKLLTDEQRDRYLKLEKLFGMPGWAIMEKWAEGNRDEARDRAASASTWEENRIAVGQRIAFDTFANLRRISEMEFEMLAANNAAEKEEESEDDHE